MKSFHEERSKSGDESGDETGDQSSEKDDMDLIEQNLLDLEATMTFHSLAFLPYRYTRLPCAAHKVHLVVEKYASHKTLLFGETLKKARGFVVKYRKSSKAKEQLRQILGEFWTELPRIAQDIRTVPATSVPRPSERLFSISGILSEDKRCNISPENLESRVLLKANSYF